MAAKTPKKFRQARKAARKDAKKIFSGRTQAGLKDKSPLMKFSEDDKKALSEIRKEAREGYITDDRGNKIQVKPVETAKERMARDRREAKAELQRRWDIEDGKEKVRESKPASKATPRITEAGKVRSAVTATEVKPQGYKVDKTGNKIKEGAGRSASQNKLLNKSKKTFGQVSKAVADKTKAPVVKKGFAAGKELNAEGKAIYDKLVKEGIKPKSALNKALFRQEKGKKPIPKTTARNDKGMTPRQEAALQRRVRKEDQRMAKLRAADPKKFDAREALARNTKLTGAEYAKERAKIGDTVRPKPAVAPKPGKFKAMQDSKRKVINVPSTVVSSKPNVPGKELVVRPKAGPVVAKPAAKKGGAKAAALGAAKFAGRALTGRAAMAVTAGSLIAGPLINQLTKDKNRVTSADVMKGREQAAIKADAAKQANKSRSNQPRVTGKGKYVGRGNIPTLFSGGSTSTYKVNAGDTLSGIAKKSGVTLSELMAANKNIKDPKKIYRNTSVKIPSKGKVPTGGYTGPVPYRPKKK